MKKKIDGAKENPYCSKICSKEILLLILNPILSHLHNDIMHSSAHLPQSSEKKWNEEKAAFQSILTDRMRRNSQCEYHELSRWISLDFGNNAPNATEQ